MKKPFELIRCPGVNGRRGYYGCNVKGVAMSARVHQEFVWLSSINVEDKGKGLGTFALLSLLVWALQRGLSVGLMAEAELAQDQRRLERWYQRLGFKRIGKSTEFWFKI